MRGVLRYMLMGNGEISQDAYAILMHRMLNNNGLSNVIDKSVFEGGDRKRKAKGNKA